MLPKNIIQTLTGTVLALILLLGFCAGCKQVDNDLLPDEFTEKYGKVIDLDPFDASPCSSWEEQSNLDEDPMQNAAVAGEDNEQAVTDDDNEEQQQLLVVSDGDYPLALVSKETILKSDYKPQDLQTVPAYMKPSYSMQLRAEALEHLELLWLTAETDGVVLHIRSAYRSYETQKWLFNDYASRHGEEEANRFSARPGQSEHQLGTAVDFGGTAVDFKAAFADTPQGLWLAENAHQFGFAMSYPEDMEHITGYIFEPWHYRYLGIEEAVAWKTSSLTLKEYLETKKQYFE